MKSANPLIGLTTYARDEKDRYHLPATYVDAVRRVGGLPALIPPGEQSPDAWLDIVCGLVLTGGGDIDPSLYGGRSHPMTYMVDAERDEWEMKLIAEVVRRGIPTLCICRGLEVLNVALGGSLVEHLTDEVGESVPHRASQWEPVRHIVRVVSSSRLHAILNETEFSVASQHHQGLRRLASPLVAAAHAPDGTVEAVELSAHPWLIGVQWHPELTSAEDPIQRRLFEAFVRAAAAMGRRAVHAA